MICISYLNTGHEGQSSGEKMKTGYPFLLTACYLMVTIGKAKTVRLYHPVYKQNQGFFFMS